VRTNQSEQADHGTTSSISSRESLKRIFGFDKVRYRGLAKNHHRLCACFALINLYLHRKRLVVLAQKCA
jgi:IS5 family transposase